MWFRSSLVAFALLGAAACSNSNNTAPHIDELAPPQARVGETVNILGTKFCQEPLPDAAIVTGRDGGGGDGGMRLDGGTIAPDAGVKLGLDAGGGFGARDICGDTPGFVTFGTAPGVLRATVDSWQQTRIIVVVPQMQAGPTSVTVTVNGLESNVMAFDVQP